MIWLQALWVQIWPYIAGLAGIIAGLFYARQSGKAAGRAEVERKQSEATAEQRRKVNAADTKLAQKSDSDIRDELAKWVRPADRDDR